MADSHIQITGLTLKPIPIASTDLFAIDDKNAKSYKVTADMMSVFALNIPQPSDNLTAKGIISSFTAEEIMAFGQPCFVNSDGKMAKSDAEFGGPLATHLALGSYAADATGNFLELGNIRNDAWAWTVGGTIYLSTTATLVQTAPSGGTDAQQILGVATSATTILFDPTPVAFTPIGKTLSVSASAAAARSTLSAAASGVNSDITQLISLSTPLSIGQGGTAATTAGAARTSLGVPSLSGTGATGTWGINISGNAVTATSASTVTTNANLTGVITSVGNATSIASQTGSGTKFVTDTNPVLVTPNIGTPSAGVLTNCTGTASGLTAGNVTTNANLTGQITSSGNVTTIAALGSFAAAKGANADITAMSGVTGDITFPTSVTFANNGATRTNVNVGDSSKDQGYDTVNTVYRSFRSTTAGVTPTCAHSQPINGVLTWDGGAIGSVTPAPGSFTTLNASGQPNFSGATLFQKRVSGNTGSSYAMDPTNGCWFDLTLNANCTITVTATLTSSQSQFTPFKITQDGTGNWTLAFAGVTWLSGSPPVMPSSIGAYITGGLIATNGVVYGYTQLQSTDSIILAALTLSTGLVGITSGSAKSAGYVGEVIQANIASGSAVSLTTATVTEITHINLTSGLWMISANPTFLGTGITGTELQAFYSTASSTSTTGQDTYNTSYSDPFAATTTGRATAAIPGYIFNSSGNTSIYLKAKATFTIGTCAAYGGLTAVRIA